MILNINDYPSIAQWPITIDELALILSTHPSDLSDLVADNVWEFNTTIDLESGLLMVEVVLRLETQIGYFWATLEALKVFTQEGTYDVFIRRVTESNLTPSSVIRRPVEAIKSIGDTTCGYNAKSPYLRCAVNPNGTCEGCEDWVLGI